MKAFLQKRPAAFALAVLIVLGSTIWNVNRALEGYAEEAEEAWEDKYGPERQLKDRCSYASQLWGLCQGHEELGGECSALRDAYNDLYRYLDDEDLAQADLCNASLDALADNARNALCALPSVSADDRDMADKYVNYMDNAGRLLRDSEYNALCRSYAERCDEPWLRFLRPVIFVDAPVPVGE